jgi:hypothetical protein
MILYFTVGPNNEKDGLCGMLVRRFHETDNMQAVRHSGRGRRPFRAARKDA